MKQFVSKYIFDYLLACVSFLADAHSVHNYISFPFIVVTFLIKYFFFLFRFFFFPFFFFLFPPLNLARAKPEATSFPRSARGV